MGQLIPLRAGASFPAHTVVTQAECEKCGHKRPTCRMQIDSLLGTVEISHACAGCLCDLLAGAWVLQARIYVRVYDALREMQCMHRVELRPTLVEDL